MTRPLAGLTALLLALVLAPPALASGPSPDPAPSAGPVPQAVPQAQHTTTTSPAPRTTYTAPTVTESAPAVTETRPPVQPAVVHTPLTARVRALAHRRVRKPAVRRRHHTVKPPVHRAAPATLPVQHAVVASLTPPPVRSDGLLLLIGAGVLFVLVGIGGVLLRTLWGWYAV